MPTPALTAALASIDAGAVPTALEGPRLDFKEDDGNLKRTLKNLADAVVCLSNADGGSLAVGISDTPRAETPPVLGVSEKLTVEVLRRGIFDRTSPPLSVPIEEFRHHGVRLLEIIVPVGGTIYATTDGTSTRRVGTECRPFTPEQQRELLAARGHIDWSAVATDVRLEDADSAELERVRHLLEVAGRDDVARRDDRRLLTDLRLADADGLLTRAGVLLIGTEALLRRAVPSWGYAYQFRATPGTEASGHLRGNRPLLAAVEVLLDAVEARRATRPLNLAGGVQLQIQDYARSAVRELVVNALVHRSFDIDGDVEVVHSVESMSVISPGGLVYGITPENILTHPSTPRHRLLFETVTLLQIAERTGQGVDRAYRELLRVGKPPPHFEDSGDQVRVVIEGGSGDDRFVRYVAGLPDDAGRDVEILLALSALRQRRSLAAPALAASVQRSPDEAQHVLTRMETLELVEPTKRTATKSTPNYRLRPEALAGLGHAVRYHAPAADVRERKTVEHVREYGFVTNATLRRLFDIDVYAARDLLRALQARGILEKSGERGFGPKVRYGRGPDFPRT